MVNATENPALADIKKLIGNIAEKQGFKNFNLDIRAISTQGANYTGDLYLVDVTEAGKDTLNLFVKATNTPEKARGMMDAHAMYKREVFVYTEIADTFHKLQDKHNVPEDKQFKFPKYYGSHLGDCEEVVVFENLAAQGFVLYDRLTPITYEYAKAGIEEIAKFHALSFALEKEDPDIFNRLIKNKDGLFGNDFEQMSELMIEFLPMNVAMVEPEHRQKIEAHFELHKHGIWKEHFAPISKHSVLVHGDYRMSNIMVKYQEKVVSSLISKYTALSSGKNIVNGNIQSEKTPVAALKPVDYQTVFYGCPLNDIIYFLFSGTDAEFRRLHFEEIIEHYHNSLADHLKLMSHDINDIYPKSTFYFELKDKMMYGIEVALCILSGVLIDPTVTVKLEDMLDDESIKENMLKMSNATVNSYKERLNGIVRDYVRWGLIK